MSVNPPSAYTEHNGLVTIAPARGGKKVELITSCTPVDGCLTVAIVGERGGDLGRARVDLHTLRQALLLAGVAAKREKEGT